jgi:predicted metal-dependent enzyme (double-stranded beta helix superfamily)
VTSRDKGKLLRFIRHMSDLVSDQNLSEREILQATGEHLRQLVEMDDWLPESFAQPHPEFYRQYLLYGDPFDRFSVVSFVWGPGQRTPIHNHTVWGAIGMLRGAEWGQAYKADGVDGATVAHGLPERLDPGMVAFVSPTIGDVHRVWNAYEDRISISIHVYGGNIGQITRAVFTEGDVAAKTFVSGYSGEVTPNLWVSGAQ